MSFREGRRVGGEGLEQVANSPVKQPLSADRGAESGAVGAPLDNDLDSIVRAWPSLSHTIRRMMLNLAREDDFR